MADQRMTPKLTPAERIARWEDEQGGPKRFTKIMRALLRGEDEARIAARWDCDRATVNVYRKALYGELTTFSMTNIDEASYRKVNAQDAARRWKALELIRGGMTIKRVAQALGLSTDYLSAMAKNFGIEVQRGGRR